MIEETLTHLTDAGMCGAEQWDRGMVIAERIEFPVAFQTCPPWSLAKVRLVLAYEGKKPVVSSI